MKLKNSIVLVSETTRMVGRRERKDGFNVSLAGKLMFITVDGLTKEEAESRFKWGEKYTITVSKEVES